MSRVEFECVFERTESQTWRRRTLGDFERKMIKRRVFSDSYQSLCLSSLISGRAVTLSLPVCCSEPSLRGQRGEQSARAKPSRERTFFARTRRAKRESKASVRSKAPRQLVLRFRLSEVYCVFFEFSPERMRFIASASSCLREVSSRN